MKTRLFLTLAGIALLASCTQKDLFDESVPQETKVSNSDIQANVQKVFGVTFDANHDWSTTTSGEVDITTDASVKKVQLLVNVVEVEDAPYYVSANSMKVLNEATNSGKSTIKLYYDAPKDNLGLYVAFITDHSTYVRKVQGNSVTFDGGANARQTRALSTGYTLPEGEFVISEKIESYASQRNWVPGEMLYGLSENDYSALKMSSADYSAEFKDMFRGIVFSYFPNGRSYNNLPKVKASGYFNEKVYPITTGEEPIIITPMYKCDQATRYGNEVYNSDLYYYYFKEEDLGNDPVAYLESLPKYKAIPFNQCFGETEDDVIGKHGSFALLFFGDGTPDIGTKGSFTFPKGYKIGFMVRAKTDSEKPKKQGEVYGDGRLNNDINKYPNFSSSKLGEDGPRAAWLSLDGKMLMCWESGTDSDFNDVILDVEGGIEPFDEIIELDPDVFTYCFEDTELGDYDLNDVVIKAYRLDETHVQYSIIACGAWDEIIIKNINVGVINDTAEVHRLFGKQPLQFINTNGGEYCDPVTVQKTVKKTFSFDDPKTQPYIYDKTTNTTIRIATAGEDPHGIMIAGDFQYPLEKICVKDAYPEFNNWGQNPINSTRWYNTPTPSRVCRR